jgi:hypothetical protein
MGKFYLETRVGGREIGKWKREIGKRRRTEDARAAAAESRFLATLGMTGF